MPEYRTYKIRQDMHGMGGFMCPPGYANHTYTLEEYTGPRGRKVIGLSSIEYALNPEAQASPAIQAQARRILESSKLTESEAWVRSVYGYFRNMYVPENGSRNASDLIHDPKHEIAPARHAAVACIREYFPAHTPRLDLIADPGKGYGSWPCEKCGERVQYEARYDAHVTVSTRIAGSGITQWTYGQECAEGGAHVVESAALAAA